MFNPGTYLRSLEFHFSLPRKSCRLVLNKPHLQDPQSKDRLNLVSNSNDEISVKSEEPSPPSATLLQKVGAAGILLLIASSWFVLNHDPTPTPLTSVEKRSAIPQGRPDQKNHPTEKAEQGEATGSPTVLTREPGSPPNEIGPSFDIVTIDPGGETVIAGQAEPGAKVTIRIDSQPIGSVIADENGEWVFVPQNPLSEGARELDLVATNKSGTEVYSDRVVVAIVPEKPTRAGDPGVNATAKALVVLMSRDGQGLDRLLQGKELADGLTSGTDLTLDLLNYDAKGQVDFSGTGQPNAEIRAYINNELIGIAKIDTDGNWQLLPHQKLEVGLYNLRIDQVDLDGKVIARLETPFSMASFEKPAEGRGLVVVQPGNSLWRLARRLYGEGIRYTTIFVANQNQIKDPSLIYPGQIFIVPEEG